MRVEVVCVRDRAQKCSQKRSTLGRPIGHVSRAFSLRRTHLANGPILAQLARLLALSLNHRARDQLDHFGLFLVLHVRAIARPSRFSILAPFFLRLLIGVFCVCVPRLRYLCMARRRRRSLRKHGHNNAEQRLLQLNRI